MPMELVKERSEDHLVNLLADIEKDPASWVNVHVNIRHLSEQMFEKESLSMRMLDNIRKSSVQVARTLMDSKLSGYEGKVFIFEDSDVMALFKKDGSSFSEVLETLRKEFTDAGLGDILFISEMRDKLAQLITLSAQKHKTAELYRQRTRAVEAGETIFSWKVPDMVLTQTIQKKRLERPAGSVLVIEDDVVARGVVTLALRDKFQVIQAKDAKSGIIAYIDQAPDAVLLDIHLPDHNGHEVLNRLKLLDPESFVLMLSEDSVAENVFLSRDGGAAGFIRKPFDKDNMLKHIEKSPNLARLENPDS